ncbi:hypothetical protein [Mycobacterium sp. E2462]|uniref:hypothetical protein n=1 Tax=Mycobacterium sp. E2462 TaxID=1834133 RepID=UPI000AB97698|nr:hypothetical protein [Mycobacterium sp. E2462]
MDGTTAISLSDGFVRVSVSYPLSSIREKPCRRGGERCRAHIGGAGQRPRLTRERVEAVRRGAMVPIAVAVCLGSARAAGNSPAGWRTGMPGRRRRIHSASTIAAASLIAAHASSSTLATPINTTSTSPCRDDLYLSI